STPRTSSAIAFPLRKPQRPTRTSTTIPTSGPRLSSNLERASRPSGFCGQDKGSAALARGIHGGACCEQEVCSSFVLFLLGVAYGRRSASQDHPCGHGRLLRLGGAEGRSRLARSSRRRRPRRFARRGRRRQL